MTESRFARGFCSFDQLRAKGIVSTRFQLQKLIREQNFPPPLKTSDSAQAAALFSVDEIDLWLEMRAARRKWPQPAA